MKTNRIAPLVASLLLAALDAGCLDAAQDRSAAPTAREIPNDAVLVAICDSTEPGERLVFSGRVLDYRGEPLSKAAVVAYQADGGGLYNPRDSQTRVPRLRAVAVTDEKGQFRFSTIKPGSYPDGSEPAHIHMAVTAPAHHVLHMEYWFEGDPLISEDHRARAERNGRIFIVRPARDAAGAWTFQHDARLDGN